jgi:hypothetical protein
VGRVVGVQRRPDANLRFGLLAPDFDIFCKLLTKFCHFLSILHCLANFCKILQNFAKICKILQNFAKSGARAAA